MNPTVHAVYSGSQRTDYRLSAGPLYCDLSIARGRAELSSYSGTAWPGAWPELFEPIPASVLGGCGGYRLTAEGQRILQEAR